MLQLVLHVHVLRSFLSIITCTKRGDAQVLSHKSYLCWHAASVVIVANKCPVHDCCLPVKRRSQCRQGCSAVTLSLVVV
eukprot:2847623-Amphidinium_carterae.1